MQTLVSISLQIVLFASYTSGKGTIIGIDLGTTYCSVAVMRDGKVEIIPNDLGNRITPSYVAFSKTGERLIGEMAKLQITHNPLNTIYNVKRLIGRKWDDEVVQREIPLLSYNVVEMENKPCIKVKIKGKDALFSPEEITAMILERMKEFAEDYIGEEVDSAVITTPAYFNEEQRQATKDAGALAGLNVRRILSEPTAAAMSFGLSSASGETKILVFDIGGGTVDVSIIDRDEGNFGVIATKGDTDLGGEDFNQRLLKHLIRKFKSESGENMASDPKAIQILRREIEQSKRELSVSLVAKIEIHNLYKGKSFFTTITRAKFEDLNEDLFNRVMSIVPTVLDDSRLQRKDIDELVVVGGSSRIIKIQQLLKDFFGKDPRQDIHPEEAIAYGAAIQAGVLSNEKHTENIVLLDVYPFSLGVEVSYGTMKTVIPRNHVVPYENSIDATTSEDNQDNMAIKIYRGEHSTTHKNVLLAQFALYGILPGPKGIPKVKITFKINSDGILNVSAKNFKTGWYEEITVENEYRKLSHNNLVKMRGRMMTFRYNDLEKEDRIKAQDKLERVVYSVKHCINRMSLLHAKTAGVTNDQSQTFYDCLSKIRVKRDHNKRKYQVEKKRDFKKEMLSIAQYTDEIIKWLNLNPNASTETMKRKKREFDEYLDIVIGKTTTEQQSNRSDEL